MTPGSAATTTALLLLLTAPVLSETLTFSTGSFPRFREGQPNHGWWSDTHRNTAVRPAYIIGYMDAPINAQARSYFTFDFSGLTSQAVSASLRIPSVVSTSQLAELTIGFYEVETDPYDLNRFGGPDPDLFDDLGSGTSYGSATVPPGADCVGVCEVVLDLNANALATINGRSGEFFSIGAALLTLDELAGEPRDVILNRDPLAEVVLVVETVPEPVTLASLVLALFMRGLTHRPFRGR